MLIFEFFLKSKLSLSTLPLPPSVLLNIEGSNLENSTSAISTLTIVKISLWLITHRRKSGRGGEQETAPERGRAGRRELVHNIWTAISWVGQVMNFCSDMRMFDDSLQLLALPLSYPAVENPEFCWNRCVPCFQPQRLHLH